QVVTSTITGFTLARLSFRGRSLIVWGYMVSMLVPAHLTLVPSFRILTSLGLIDTLGALIVPFLAGALGTLVMQRQFANLPREMEEAAWLDGCSTWDLIRFVLLPAVAPGLRAVATLMVLFSWNNLFWPLVMT